MLNELFPHINTFVALIGIIALSILIAVCVDLLSGIKRSVRLGMPITSKGLRASLWKLSEYMLFLLIATLMDNLLYLSPTYELFGVKYFPWCALATGIVVIIIEGSSVIENTDRNRKKEIALALKNLSRLARTKGEARELLATISDLFSEYTEEESTTIHTPKDNATQK